MIYFQRQKYEVKVIRVNKSDRLEKGDTYYLKLKVDLNSAAGKTTPKGIINTRCIAGKFSSTLTIFQRYVYR